MNAQEILTQIDHAFTEIDLVLHEWTEAVDMMSFIGQDVPLKLWTNDTPPVVLELTDFPNLLACQDQDVRVMHFRDGEWTRVGSARVNRMSGRLIATIEDGEVADMLRGPSGANPYSFAEKPLAHFSLDEVGDWKQLFPLNPPFEGANKPLTEFSIYSDKDWDIDNNVPLKDSPTWWNGIPEETLENHPFFNTKEEN